jgi:hypothetical protein
MLFILTGDIQIGKTRWLTALTEELATCGVSCFGVLSPGIWREQVDEGVDEGGRVGADEGVVTYEKLGIEVVLLPQGTRLPFALRRDLVFEQSLESSAPQSEVARPETLGARCLKTPEAARLETQEADRPKTKEADRAALGWAIRDEAIAAVNAHFDHLSADHLSADHLPKETPGLLVIDELGRLELMHEGGFTSAVRLLESGPQPQWPHALIIARDRLVDLAYTRFSTAWNEVSVIGPTDDARTQLLRATD